jgi:hypothetical protein
MAVNQTSHGDNKRGKRAPEYTIWHNMMARCYKPKSTYFHNYGGRGISVCDEWRNDYKAFLLDMGRRPGREYSIERIDNNQGYSKENCKWATRIDQANNARSNRLVEYAGEILTVAQWSRKYGIAYRKLHWWLKNRNWDLGVALAGATSK